MSLTQVLFPVLFPHHDDELLNTIDCPADFNILFQLKFLNYNSNNFPKELKNTFNPKTRLKEVSWKKGSFEDISNENIGCATST